MIQRQPKEGSKTSNPSIQHKTRRRGRRGEKKNSNEKEKKGTKEESMADKIDVNAKWDACLDLTVRRFVYSSLAGAFGGLLLFSQSLSHSCRAFVWLPRKLIVIYIYNRPRNEC